MCKHFSLAGFIKKFNTATINLKLSDVKRHNSPLLPQTVLCCDGTVFSQDYYGEDMNLLCPASIYYWIAFVLRNTENFLYTAGKKISFTCI